jgi:putative flippase GtrA
VARFLRYAVGSAIASVVSAAVLAATAWTSIVAPAVSSVIAFIAGALVNFAVYRFWAWPHTVTRAVAAIGRDFARYAVIAVSTAAVATGATYVAGEYADHAALGSAARTLLLEGSFFGAFAVMFAAKFVILDRYVFVHRRAETASDAGTHAPGRSTEPR